MSLLVSSFFAVPCLHLPHCCFLSVSAVHEALLYWFSCPQHFILPYLSTCHFTDLTNTRQRMFISVSLSPVVDPGQDCQVVLVNKQRPTMYAVMTQSLIACILSTAALIPCVWVTSLACLEAVVVSAAFLVMLFSQLRIGKYEGAYAKTMGLVQFAPKPTTWSFRNSSQVVATSSRSPAPQFCSKLKLAITMDEDARKVELIRMPR